MLGLIRGVLFTDCNCCHGNISQHVYSILLPVTAAICQLQGYQTLPLSANSVKVVWRYRYSFFHPLFHSPFSILFRAWWCSTEVGQWEEQWKVCSPKVISERADRDDCDGHCFRTLVWGTGGIQVLIQTHEAHCRVERNDTAGPPCSAKDSRDETRCHNTPQERLAPILHTPIKWKRERNF